MVEERRHAGEPPGVEGLRDDGSALNGPSSGPRLPPAETRSRTEARTPWVRTPRYARASLEAGSQADGARAGEAPDRIDARRNGRTKILDPENLCPGLQRNNHCVLKAPSWESDHELQARRRAQRILRLHADR